MKKLTTILFFVILILISIGCGIPIISNVLTTKELQGKTILAGRFLFYEDEVPSKIIYRILSKSDYTYLVSLYKRQIDGRWIRIGRFDPDKEGYIYVAVDEGEYGIFSVFYRNYEGEYASFNFDQVPAFYVKKYDEGSIVNFGTFEIRGYNVGIGFLGRRGMRLNMNHLADYETTRPQIARKFEGLAGPIKDINVFYYNRK